MPTHDDDHGHAMATAQDDSPPGYYEIMETAVRELLVERTLIGPGEIRRQIEVLDSRTPALGAKVVGRARVDPDFRKRLLANGRTACEEEFGISFYDDTELIVLENTEKVVLPRRPEGTENFSEEQLASLVTRDAMIGVVPVQIPTRSL